MEVTTSSTTETKKLAEQLAKKLKPGDILCLYGDLGSGKTTFTGYLVKALDIDARVQSPTFVIARRYSDEKRGAGSGAKNKSDKESHDKNKNKIKTVNHIDLYRLSSVDEVTNIGLQEYFEEPAAITVIEWPEIAEKLFPKNCIKIYFEYIDEDERTIKTYNLH